VRRRCRPGDRHDLQPADRARVVRHERHRTRRGRGVVRRYARAWAPTPFDVADGEPVRLSTRDLRLEIEASPLRLTFADAAGAWLLREPADGGMAVERGADGGARVRARFTFSGEQHFYGLGHGGGRLDRLGHGRQLWNSHLGHGPARTSRSRSWCRAAATRCSSTIRATRSSRSGRSDNGVRVDYTAEASRSRGTF
jgi:hypothetical protein